MTADNQLLYETRLRQRQAVVAAAAALLLLLAATFQLAGPQPKVSELTIQLIVVNQRFPLDLIGAVLEAAGLLGLAWTLTFLFDVTRARKPQIASATRIAVIAGAVVGAVGAVAYAAFIAVKAHQFVSNGTQSYLAANQLIAGSGLPAVQILDFAGQLALDVGIVLISLNAMRVGILPRFLGYLGMIVAAASVFLIGSPPAIAVEIFWLIALAYLFWGRWPSGDPPAWQTGQAVPWVASRKPREPPAKAERDVAREKSPSRTAPEPAPEAVSAQTARGTRATTPKRKRKRRR